MGYVFREYQSESISCNVHFLTTCKKRDFHGLCILPTGSGKSLVIAGTVSGIQQVNPGAKILVFQPSKEILEQNFSKYVSYGFRAGIYSASGGMKFRDQVTFATIGSVASKPHLFVDYKYILIDECHLVNSNAGMYLNFINSIPKVKVIGLTATPYRLSSSVEGAQLRFLTRTSPRVFNKVLYFVQNDVLFNAGYLAPLRYFPFDVIRRDMLEMNNSGTDYTDASIKAHYRKINMPHITIGYANRLLLKRRNLLVFCALIDDAEKVVAGIPGAVIVTGNTEAKLRDKILSQFKKGIIKCVVNVGVLTTGFDYPELECVLIARSTMSLALYYQIIGRVMRPYTFQDGTKKDGWVVDLGGNIKFFGKIETMRIQQTEKGLYYISNNGRQLTNVTFQK